jgi:hypothetical protein
MKNKLTNEELYIIQDALISYKYGRVNKSHCPKDKILAIQMKLLSMEDK